MASSPAACCSESTFTVCLFMPALCTTWNSYIERLKRRGASRLVLFASLKIFFNYSCSVRIISYFSSARDCSDISEKPTTRQLHCVVLFVFFALLAAIGLNGVSCSFRRSTQHIRTIHVLESIVMRLFAYRCLRTRAKMSECFSKAGTIKI